MLNTNTTVYYGVCIEHSICIELGILLSSTHFGIQHSFWHPFLCTLILKHAVVASSWHSLSHQTTVYSSLPTIQDWDSIQGWLAKSPVMRQYINNLHGTPMPIYVSVMVCVTMFSLDQAVRRWQKSRMIVSLNQLLLRPTHLVQALSQQLHEPNFDAT